MGNVEESKRLTGRSTRGPTISIDHGEGVAERWKDLIVRLVSKLMDHGSWIMGRELSSGRKSALGFGVFCFRSSPKKTSLVNRSSTLCVFQSEYISPYPAQCRVSKPALEIYRIIRLFGFSCDRHRQCCGKGASITWTPMSRSYSSNRIERLACSTLMPRVFDRPSNTLE